MLSIFASKSKNNFHMFIFVLGSIAWFLRIFDFLNWFQTQLQKNRFVPRLRLILLKSIASWLGCPQVATKIFLIWNFI